MIYNDEKLKNMSTANLKKHEKKLTEDLKESQKYWLDSYRHNEEWADKVARNVECLKQVRKHIFGR